MPFLRSYGKPLGEAVAPPKGGAPAKGKAGSGGRPRKTPAAPGPGRAGPPQGGRPGK